MLDSERKCALEFDLDFQVMAIFFVL